MVYYFYVEIPYQRRFLKIFWYAFSLERIDLSAYTFGVQKNIQETTTFFVWSDYGVPRNVQTFPKLREESLSFLKVLVLFEIA